jgi:tetraacyldisaccharide 4'-kinase
MMRAPRFWQNPPDQPGILARLLAPFGWVYAAGTARRLRKLGLTCGVPVICIGNLNVGGTGKTPTAIALIERLTSRGRQVHIVSRGYGGALQGPVLVDPACHTAAQTGDEPLLLAAFTPTWVAKNRAQGVLAACAAGAEVILLDDGFQNPAVNYDLSIIVVDAEMGFGNGRCLPAGPLREPVAAGLARADAVLVIGTDAARAQFIGQWGAQVRQPLLSGQLRPIAMGIDWLGERVLAFAGIGRPEKFFATLRDLGATLLRCESMPDHQPFSETLLRRLQAEALLLHAQLVTTEKDAVRLPPAFRSSVISLPVRLHLADWTVLDAAFHRLGL